MTLPQGHPKSRPHPHTLHDQLVANTSDLSIVTMHFLTQGDWKSDSDDHQPHDSGIHIRQMQSQYSPLHCLHAHPFQTANHMYPLKFSLWYVPLRDIHPFQKANHIYPINFSLGSFPLRDIPIPKETHPHNGAHQNVKLGGTKLLWYVYMVHTLGFGQKPTEDPHPQGRIS